MRTIKNKTDTMKQIETKLGGDIEEILRAYYVDDALSAHQIANKLGISYVTTVHWLQQAGVYSHRIKVGST